MTYDPLIHPDCEDPEAEFSGWLDRLMIEASDVGVSADAINEMLLSQADLQDVTPDGVAFESAEIEMVPDEDPDLSHLPEGSQRHKNYGMTWTMVGIRATATIRVDGVAQTVKSGGLWGVASDSDRGYFDEVAREELRALADMLDTLGADPGDGLEAEWATGTTRSGTVSIE